MHVRLVGNLGLNAGVSWLSDTDDRNCFICKNGVEDACHFFFDCMFSEKISLSYGLT